MEYYQESTIVRRRSPRGGGGKDRRVATMRERVEMAGGWCQLRSLPGDGTTLEFWVPGVAPRPSEPSEGDDEDVSVEPQTEETDSVPLSVGGPTIET